MTPALSIIVPVYNVEAYIEECLRSLVSQDAGIDEYEVVVVDDGSPDSSIDIVDGFDWKGVPHIVITQKNAGLGAARNAGLDKASGEYVWFVDSDDWISGKSLGGILASLKGQDVLAFDSYFREDSSGSHIDRKDIEGAPGPGFTKKDFYHPAPFYVYRRAFLVENTLRFVAGIYHEDSLFSPQTLYLASSVSVYPEPVYHYRDRIGSITGSVNPKRLRDLMFAVESHVSFARDRVSSADRWRWLGASAGSLLNSLLALSGKCPDSETAAEVRRFLDGDRMWGRILLHSPNVNSRVMGLLSSVLGMKLTKVYGLLSGFRYKG